MSKRPTELVLKAPADYPQVVCNNCGEKWGYKDHVRSGAFWIEGVCDVCHQTRSVTDPMYFGHLKVVYKHGK